MFEDTSLFIWWAITTYVVGIVFIGLHGALKKSGDELESTLRKRLDEIVHRVRIEKDRDTYYWYDMDNGKFLAQGSSDEEIVSSLKNRFPTHMFFLPTNHLICAKTDWQPKAVGK